MSSIFVVLSLGIFSCDTCQNGTKEPGELCYAIQEVLYVGEFPVAVSLGDLDNDGDLDLVTANDLELSLLQNQGGGRFSTQVSIQVGINPNSLQIQDLDGDLDLDLAVLSASDGALLVLKNDGSAQFVQTPIQSVGSLQELAGGDFDGDSDVDLVGLQSIPGNPLDHLVLLFNDGTAVFTLSAPIEVGDVPSSISVGDIDGDFDLDLLVANQAPDTGISDDVSVLLNLGDGQFAPQIFFTAGAQAIGSALGDFDSDNTLDLAIADGRGKDIILLLNSGAGIFSTPVSIPVGENITQVAAGDFDSDSDLDLVTNGANRVNVFQNNGNMQFALAESFFVGNNPLNLTVGDLNQDSIFDIVAANLDSSSVSVLLSEP